MNLRRLTVKVLGELFSFANCVMAADLSHCLEGHIGDLNNELSGGVEGPSSFLSF